MKRKAESAELFGELDDHEEELEYQQEEGPEGDENLLLRTPGFGMDQIEFEAYKGEILYRGTKLGSDSAFSRGFRPFGKNKDLLKHIKSPEAAGSAYVSTSTSKAVASTFPKHIPQGVTQTYVYEIHPAGPTINVREEILKQGVKLSDGNKLILAKEKEKVRSGKIKGTHLKGYWPVEITKVLSSHAESLREFGYPEAWIQENCYEYVRTIKGEFISNPNYQPPGNLGVKSLKLGGRVLSWGAVALDAASFTIEYQQSMKTGAFSNTHREMNRIGSGLTGAVSMGTLFAAYGAVLTPVGQAALGLTGSILGYYGASNLAVELYDRLNPKKAEAFESRVIITERGLTCSVTTYKDGARIGKCVVSGNLRATRTEQHQRQAQDSQKDKKENRKESTKYAKDGKIQAQAKAILKSQSIAASVELYMNRQQAPTAPAFAYQEIIHESGIAKIAANLRHSEAQPRHSVARSAPALVSQNAVTSVDLYLGRLETQTAPALAYREAIHDFTIARLSATSSRSEGGSSYPVSRSEPGTFQSSRERVLDNFRELNSSQYERTYMTPLCNSNLSQFTGYTPTTHRFSSQATADYWNTFGNGYGRFEKEPDPVYSLSGGSSFFGSRGGSDRGGKGYYCDSRGNCYSFGGGGGSCHDSRGGSSSGRCESSIKF